MIKERKINEVFMDSENFVPAKRLKCVEDNDELLCHLCAYNYNHHYLCKNVNCLKCERLDNNSVYFIETNELLKDDKLCHEN